MEKELLQRIALEQREYWKAVSKETGLTDFTQQTLKDSGLAKVDPETLTPKDWELFWGRFVAPDLS